MDYKCKEGMIDNQKVKDSHQEGISRVIQRKSDKKDTYGHSGKMGVRHDQADWSRKGDPLTPRKA